MTDKEWSSTHATKMWDFPTKMWDFQSASQPLGVFFFSLVDLKTNLKEKVKCKNGHKGACQNTFPWLVYLFQLWDSLRAVKISRSTVWNRNGLALCVALALWAAGSTKCFAFWCKTSTIREVSHLGSYGWANFDSVGGGCPWTKTNKQSVSLQKM